MTSFARRSWLATGSVALVVATATTAQLVPSASATPSARLTAAAAQAPSPVAAAERGRRALASLRHPTPSGVSVSFLGARSGYLGLTYPARHHVDVFVRSCSA